MQMYTIHQSIYTVITKPRNENCTAKKKSQKSIPFIEIIKHN